MSQFLQYSLIIYCIIASIFLLTALAFAIVSAVKVIKLINKLNGISDNIIDSMEQLRRKMEMADLFGAMKNIINKVLKKESKDE